MPKVVGIDLAGLAENETGICALTFSDDPNIGKVARVRKVKTDAEILSMVDEERPVAIAIDAPLSVPISGSMRGCDSQLQKYGALSPLLGGMKYLTERGMGLADMMRGESEVIEVNAKMTAKMLGYHNADLAAQQKEMIRMGVRGDTEKRMLKCDEQIGRAHV